MIITAIDNTDFGKASMIIDNLDPKKCMVKIGSVAFNSSGPKLIHYAAENGFKIFLDLKLHDIPNTVKKSIGGLTSLPISMLTIHISGGKDMILAAKEAVEMGSTQKMAYVRRCEDSLRKKLERNDEWFIVEHSSIL